MVTISQIASEAGVSRTTVSYVLNQRENGVRISDQTAGAFCKQQRRWATGAMPWRMP
jgi:hypothetical protein